MRASPLVAAMACLTTGAALYASRGVMDQIVTSDGPVRAAWLPPWQSLVGFLVLSAIGLVGLHRRHAPRGSTTTMVRPALGPLVLPALALGVLLVPYLPVLPDRWPILQALAGPGRWIVWLVVLLQLGWVSWQVRPARMRALDGAPLWQMGLLAGAVVAVLSSAAASRLTGTILFPAGDEPHYLVIAQSLWRDGDLKIENNHDRGDYREYFSRSLDPHYLTRGTDGEIYSIHPIGLPVLMAPVYALGGYALVVISLILLAACAAGLAWAWIAPVAGIGAATFGIGAVAATSPFLLNSFTVYPEIAAALAVVAAIILATRRDARWPHWLACGVACGALPWLSSKYALMSGVLLLVGAGRALGARDASTRVRAMAALAVPYGVAVLAWFAFFYAYWGSPWPSAPYGAMLQTHPKYLAFGAPGLLFDQEYGLLAYAPVYALAAGGFVAMWRAGDEQRRRAIEIALVLLALAGTVGAFRIWWGGSAAPARPMVSGLLLLAMPMAAAFKAARAGTARRAAQHALLWASVGLTVVLLTAQNGLLIANDRDGTSRLVEYLSPRWEAWTLVPSFIHHEAGTAIVHALAWVALASTGAALLARLRAMHPGRASLAALATIAGVLASVAIVIPWLPAEPPQPRVDVEARSKSDLLSGFDRAALPNALVFDPLRIAEPVDIVPRISLTVRPGARRDPQPIRVLHNGRVSLPAGEYDVEVRWADEAEPSPDGLALQVGRIGPPIETWTVEPRPGGTWRASFALPVDADFVALRGTTVLERAISAISFLPRSVVDAGRRARVPPALAAQRYGDVTALFHDGNAYVEEAGVWTIGGRTTSVTLAFADTAQPHVLRVHSGAEPNRAVLTAGAWQAVLDLAPGAPRDLVLPDDRALVHLRIDTAEAFVPSALDPSDPDSRALGIWIEFPR